jgi:multidrug efflux pump subunit AcrA (membrane-fusion protein)
VPVASLVDIHTVRMVANLVEKDVRRVTVGTHADIDVDAYPGETFTGRVSRVAPVFDPATRTAEMEIEVPNPGFRLKPGMYARVQLTVATRPNAITVPSNAVIRLDGKTGVFVAQGRSGGGPGSVGAPAERTGTTGGSPAANADDKTMAVRFLPIEIGINDGQNVEIVSGVSDGARVITTGAGALKDGDRVVAATAEGGRRGNGSGAPSGSPTGAQGTSQRGSR